VNREPWDLAEKFVADDSQLAKSERQEYNLGVGCPSRKTPSPIHKGVGFPQNPLRGRR
jgi:hypothetical protein